MLICVFFIVKSSYFSFSNNLCYDVCFRENVHLEGGLTVEDAIRILSEDEESEIDVTDIFITPPDASELTDEDSGDDDGGLVDNLTGR